MSVDAIRYYLTWLRRTYSPVRLYQSLIAVWLSFALALSFYLRVETGSWSDLQMVGVLALLSLAGGALSVGAIRLGSRIGSWSLLERLEAGSRMGYTSDVWSELMIKYRGFIPEVVAHERFQALLIKVGTEIIAREKLTLEQAKWMDELLSCTRSKLASGSAGKGDSKAKFVKPVFVAAAVVSVLVALIKLWDLHG